MSLDEILAQLTNVGRGVGQNIGNFLANPPQALGNALTRWAGENLPSRMDTQDAMSVMPGMGDQFTGRINSLANPLGTVLKMPASRLGWPSMEPRVLLDGRKLDIESLGMPERLLANTYGSHLMRGMAPERAAEQTALWGMMHPQIGTEYVNSVLPRLSAAPMAEVTKLRSR